MTGGGFFCLSHSRNVEEEAHSSSDAKPGTTSSPTSPPQPTILRVAVGSSNPSKVRAVQQALERALRQEQHHLPSRGLATTANNPPIQTPIRGGGGGGDDPSSSMSTSRGEQRDGLTVLDVQGFDVDSGVSHQPFGDDETKRGATTRCRAAFRAYKEKVGIAPHLAIGMEGGLEWLSHDSSSNNGTNGTSQQEQRHRPNKKELYCMAWMAAYGRRTGFLVDLFAASETTTYIGDKKPIFGFSKTATFPMPESLTQLIQTGMELGDADDQIFGRHQSKQGSGTIGILTNGLIDRSAYYEHALQLALIPWIRPDLYPHGIQ